MIVVASHLAHTPDIDSWRRVRRPRAATAAMSASPTWSHQPSSSTRNCCMVARQCRPEMRGHCSRLSNVRVVRPLICCRPECVRCSQPRRLSACRRCNPAKERGVAIGNLHQRTAGVDEPKICDVHAMVKYQALQGKLVLQLAQAAVGDLERALVNDQWQGFRIPPGHSGAVQCAQVALHATWQPTRRSRCRGSSS